MQHAWARSPSPGYAQAVKRADLLGFASLSLLLACTNHTGPGAPVSAGSPAAKPAASFGGSPPLATPGEHMQYKLSLQGVELAGYELAIGDVADLGGKQAIVIQGHAKTVGFVSFLATIDDRFTSWVDVANGRPLRFQTDEYASGSKTDIEHAVVDLAGRTGNTITVTFHVNDTPPRDEAQLATQSVVWDYNAFLLALRAWEGPPGSAQSFEVFRSRYLWHVDVTIHGKDTLSTELGELPALRIDGRTYKLDRKGVRDGGSAERTFSMWISDDDGRVPLEIRATTDYGDLKMRIVDYQPGTGKRLR